jgi:hypothetical protein
VAGVSIYVLGLIGLTIPIRRPFTRDLSTAWYAVSLIPKTVLAGHGVRIWLRWPTAFVVITLFSTAISSAILLTLDNPYETSWRSLVAEVILAVGTLFVVFFIGSHLITKASRPRTRWLTNEGSKGAGWGWMLMMGPIYTGAIVIQLAGGMMLKPGQSLLLLSHPLLPSFVADIARQNLLLTTIITLYFGGFLVGIPAAISVRPPLPWAKIAKRPPEGSGQRTLPPLEGHLVAHSDGFWHLFVGTEEQHELLSVPDSEALSVYTLGELQTTTMAETAPEEHEKPDEENRRVIAAPTSRNPEIEAPATAEV